MGCSRSMPCRCPCFTPPSRRRRWPPRASRRPRWTPAEHPETRPKKNIMEIMAAHRIPYAATCTPAYPEDLVTKFRKAKEMRGTRFIHILSVCPPGWKMPSDQAIEVMRLAVRSRGCPLYEIEGGLSYTVNLWPDEEVAVEDYFRMQGRFRPLFEDPAPLEQGRGHVEDQWATLVRRHERTHPADRPPPTPRYRSPL